MTARMGDAKASQSRATVPGELAANVVGGEGLCQCMLKVQQ